MQGRGRRGAAEVAVVVLLIGGRMVGGTVAVVAALDLFDHAFREGGDESVRSGVVALLLGSALWLLCGGPAGEESS